MVSNGGKKKTLQGVQSAQHQVNLPPQKLLISHSAWKPFPDQTAQPCAPRPHWDPAAAQDMRGEELMGQEREKDTTVITAHPGKTQGNVPAGCHSRNTLC